MKNESIYNQLIRHEGKKNKMYLDSLGIPTIGVGWNLRDVPMREDEIALRLKNDVAEVIASLQYYFSWFNSISEERKKALIDFAFAGIGTVLKFKNMIAYMEKGDWEHAADELLNSTYAKQVGNRAKELADMLRSG